ncbi:hypothetical protein B0T11DRAFT_332039 [Plectosphaerella cucumerina]|uniref:Uncharacterized protein n=1 Tax=Plectosphaerella cucumerina TaxID=40658 RepID=A0A8K0TD37_9PEZI|nr:hypothetical protein B0T11DRAFT_332039 [Plectosphaerella cucumerina]
MCVPVICNWTCNHVHTIIYRCRGTPRGSPQAQIDRCMERQAATNGYWETFIEEPCPICAERERARRREMRRRAREAEIAASTAMAFAAIEPRRGFTNGNNTPAAPRARPDRDNRAAAAGTNEEGRLQEAAARHLRPLESNYLQNVGRAGGNFPVQMTPSQIWHSYQ